MNEEFHELPRLDRAHVWHPYTPHSAVEAGLPVIVAGEGPWLVDSEGRRWLDAIASWWSCALGHRHPEVIAAIEAQLGRLDHSILGHLTHPAAVRLAESLARHSLDGRVHVLFASDGASAVEAAIKIALQYHAQRGQARRRWWVGLDGAYHGDTLAAVGLGFLEQFHRPFQHMCPPAIRLPVPRELDEVESYIRMAEQRLAIHRGEVAGIIVEPMCQGAAGMRIYPAEYLAALFRWSREEGCLFVADEIATGFGRTGRWWAFEHAGIAPDILCAGKALSAGTLPISATIVRDEIYESFSDYPEDHTFYHGHTFAGNPLAAAAGVAAIQVYERERLPERAAALGNTVQELLRPLRNHPAVRSVRGLGLIAAVELYSAEAARAVRQRLWSERILVRPLGPVVYLMPPLNIEDTLLQWAVERLRAAILDLSVHGAARSPSQS